MRDCNFYRIVTESVLNGIGFGLIKNLLGSLRAILQESEAKLKMKIFNPPLFFVWR